MFGTELTCKNLECYCQSNTWQGLSCSRAWAGRGRGVGRGVRGGGVLEQGGVGLDKGHSGGGTRRAGAV